MMVPRFAVMETTTKGSAIMNLLDRTPQLPQRQDSTNDQDRDVKKFLQQSGLGSISDTDMAMLANRLGCYDAADLYNMRARCARA